MSVLAGRDVSCRIRWLTLNTIWLPKPLSFWPCPGNSSCCQWQEPAGANRSTFRLQHVCLPRSHRDCLRKSSLEYSPILHQRTAPGNMAANSHVDEVDMTRAPGMLSYDSPKRTLRKHGAEIIEGRMLVRLRAQGDLPKCQSRHAAVLIHLWW